MKFFNYGLLVLSLVFSTQLFSAARSSQDSDLQELETFFEAFCLDDSEKQVDPSSRQLIVYQPPLVPVSTSLSSSLSVARREIYVVIFRDGSIATGPYKEIAQLCSADRDNVVAVLVLDIDQKALYGYGMGPDGKIATNKIDTATIPQAALSTIMGYHSHENVFDVAAKFFKNKTFCHYQNLVEVPSRAQTNLLKYSNSCYGAQIIPSVTSTALIMYSPSTFLPTSKRLDVHDSEYGATRAEQSVVKRNRNRTSHADCDNENDRTIFQNLEVLFLGLPEHASVLTPPAPAVELSERKHEALFEQPEKQGKEKKQCRRPAKDDPEAFARFMSFLNTPQEGPSLQITSSSSSSSLSSHASRSYDYESSDDEDDYTRTTPVAKRGQSSNSEGKKSSSSTKRTTRR
ncbi:hypothetical protein K2X40_03720 [Candidatus Babeliales bacterium]|nr:hypothetical protein [Candidatus Babeliales bacterium]